MKKFMIITLFSLTLGIFISSCWVALYEYSSSQLICETYVNDRDKYAEDIKKFCQYYQGEICQIDNETKKYVCMRDPQICIGACHK